MTQSLDLTNQQFKALVKAIEKAFDQVELDSLLQLECGRRLDTLVALPMLWGPLVTQVVRKAEMQDFTDATVQAWQWRPYNGASPHAHHVHISVRPEPARFDDASGLNIEVEVSDALRPASGCSEGCGPCAAKRPLDCNQEGERDE